jgi:hypothetical protein
MGEGLVGMGEGLVSMGRGRRLMFR